MIIKINNNIDSYNNCKIYVVVLLNYFLYEIPINILNIIE